MTRYGPDLLDELDEAEYCRCGKTYEECAEDGGCKWSRRDDLAAKVRRWLAEYDAFLALDYEARKRVMAGRRTFFGDEAVALLREVAASG